MSIPTRGGEGRVSVTVTGVLYTPVTPVTLATLRQERDMRDCHVTVTPVTVAEMHSFFHAWQRASRKGTHISGDGFQDGSLGF
jgi:hypothetical protein